MTVTLIQSVAQESGRVPLRALLSKWMLFKYGPRAPQELLMVPVCRHCCC